MAFSEVDTNLPDLSVCFLMQYVYLGHSDKQHVDGCVCSELLCVLSLCNILRLSPDTRDCWCKPSLINVQKRGKSLSC